MIKEKKRPLLITIVGVLSFIGLAFSFDSGIVKILNGVSIITSERIENNGTEGINGVSILVETLKTQNDSQWHYTNKLNEYSLLLGITTLISAVISLTGVIWMWKLRRKGYLFYLAGEMVPFMVTGIIAGINFSDTLLLVSLSFSSLLIIFWTISLRYYSSEK